MWNFGDGTTSNVANPVHAYQKAGTYSVKLTVTDNKGKTALAQTTAMITFAKAAPIPLKQTVTAAIEGKDNKDIFKFTLKSASDLNIRVTKGEEHGLSWMLYPAYDTNNYVAYPT